MTHTKRFSARAVLLVTGTAGFVALGAGVAGAEALATPAEALSPVVERALVEGVAPTVNTLAPEGVTPIADRALAELQETANAEKPAPDLGAVLPESRLSETVTRTQDATGLDGDPHDTVGHTVGRHLESTAQDAGTAVEGTARQAGTTTESTATEVLPHTVQAVADLRDEMLVLPELDTTQLPSLEDRRLPELSEAPSLDDVTGNVTELTGDNALVLDELNPVTALSEPRPTPVHTSAAVPPEGADLTAPNVWDLAAAFGLETPGQIQDVVESTELTADNYVNLGEEEVLGMVGNRAWEDRDLTTVPQSSPTAPTTLAEAPDAPRVTDLTNALAAGASDLGSAEPVSLQGPLADAGLPQVAEGIDTTTAEDLVNGLSRGTDLLNDLDTSDLVSIAGGTAEPETPVGRVPPPTFRHRRGSEALPLVR